MTYMVLIKLATKINYEGFRIPKVAWCDFRGFSKIRSFKMADKVDASVIDALTIGRSSGI